MHQTECSGGIELYSGGIELYSGGIELYSGGIELYSGGIELYSGGIELYSGGIELVVLGSSDMQKINKCFCARNECISEALKLFV